MFCFVMDLGLIWKCCRYNSVSKNMLLLNKFYIVSRTGFTTIHVVTSNIVL